MTELTTTSQVIDVLGGFWPVAKLTKRKYTAVTHWPHFQNFPPDTADAMRAALADLGYTAPPSLWRMVPVPNDASKDIA